MEAARPPILDHLALFGFAPVEHDIGRDVLIALGIDIDGKLAAIENLDSAAPRMLDVQQDLTIVTGDHSTPSALASHSWHTVPVLLGVPNRRVDQV